MFEIGKKYKYKYNIYECLAVFKYRQGEIAGAMRFVPDRSMMTIDPEDHGDIPHVKSWTDDWQEVREPVVHKFVRHVTTSDDNRDLETWRNLSNASLDYEDTHVGSVEFVVTDGKLTACNIL